MCFKYTKLKIKDGLIGENIGFQRIRRITGYLVGDLNRFNPAKRAEERDRAKHDILLHDKMINAIINHIRLK